MLIPSVTAYDVAKGKNPEQHTPRALSTGNKQIACDYLPHLGSRTTITGGDLTNRALGNYAKSAKSPEMDDYLGGFSVPYSSY